MAKYICLAQDPFGWYTGNICMPPCTFLTEWKRALKGLKLSNDMILLNWFLGSGRSDTLIRLVKNRSKVHLFSGSSVLINLLVHPAEKCCWSLPLYDCPYFHVYLMLGGYVCVCARTHACICTYMCIFLLFEKFVVAVVMVVTLK